MITLHQQKSVTFQYCSSGLFVAHKEWIHPRRMIDSFELIYPVNGTIYIQEEKEQFSVSEGELLILQPNVIHFGYQKSVEKTSFYWVHFEVSNFDALGIHRGKLTTANNYSLATLFKQLLHVANAQDYPSYGAELVLAQILSEVFAGMHQDSIKGTARLKEIVEWIRINSERRLTVLQVAERFHYHPDYLCTLFKKKYNKSLKEYISWENIKYIKNLLLTSDASIKELARFLGWENENQFNHYFKYHEKISPVKFRNLYSNTHLNKK